MSSKTEVYCQTEFGVLKEVIVCKPQFMEIKEPINQIQQSYLKDNINKDLACEQHNLLIEAMEQHGVNVYHLNANKQFPEQVFMRDSGFTIGNSLYIARLESEIRQGEEEELSNYLASLNKPYHRLKQGTIEGGDIILAGSTIYIGASGRTSHDSMDELQYEHPDLDFQWIDFDHSYLHLDCVFQPVSDDLALIYRKAIEPRSLEKIEKRFSLIDVPEEEQFHLGVNILSIGNGKIIALPMNKQTNKSLEEKGFVIIEVEFSEIIKSGGSFRCVTLPVLREE
ncbi:arginine deiminase family protein [Bacillus sp. JCM 19041]|uniref:dimethylarginine dimethylaminohydrolase family protein n=1 Tax=Bacillus sp. JCM 19041 TaxID=1460637 RepID=UPI0006D0CAFE